MLVLVDDLFLLDPVVDLDREVDAEPDEDRETRDRDQAEVDADEAEDREGPQHADEHGEQRQEPPADPEHEPEHHCHHAERDRAQREHAALQVVVDLLEVHGRAGDREVEAVELDTVEDVEDLLGRGRLGVEVEVAPEHDAADRGLRVREGAGEREPDVALVVRWSLEHPVDQLEVVVPVDEHVVPRRIAEHLLVDLAEAGETDLDVGTPHVGSRGVAGRGTDERGPSRTLDECVAEREGDRRRDHRVHVRDRFELGGQPLERREIVARDQIGHVDPVAVGGHEQDDRLPAEVVLELDVVDRDLGVGVEIAVLPCREFHLREPESEQDRDHDRRGRHHFPVLAELNPGTPPERFHMVRVRHVNKCSHSARRERSTSRISPQSAGQPGYEELLLSGWRAAGPSALGPSLASSE